jgi:hypothetical protein
MGVYGNCLEFFGELLERQEFYSQEPTESGGYRNQKVLGTFGVVFQSAAPRGLARNGGRWRGLDIKDGLAFWCAEPIAVGAFFRPEHRGGVYRVEGLLDYAAEGGFYRYICSRVTGADGSRPGRLALKRGDF